MAATTINQINLESKRCIYVKLPDGKSEIYFSNYYLNQQKKNQVVTPNTLANQFTFKFDNENFMNDSLIQATNKLNTAKLDTYANKNISTNIDNLDMSLYSKLTYDDTSDTAELNVTISEDIIKTIKDDTNPMEDKYIFTNIEQVRQYLKYDGLWYRGRPKKYEFDAREQTKPVEATQAEEEEIAGGKKTTTRRRGKTGHNKHRKSKRR